MPVATFADTVLPVVPSPFYVSAISKWMFQKSDRDSDLILLTAHRGLWEQYPENSAYALQEAWNRQFESVEVDARFTSDKVLVISHDYVIDRISNGHGLIYQKSFADLQALDLRDRRGKLFKDSKGRTAKFLSFSEALDLLAEYVKADGKGYLMVVDVKNAADDQDPTDPYDIIQRCLDVLAEKRNPQLSKAVFFKMRSRDAVDLGTFLQRTTYDPTVNGGIIIAENATDPTAKDSNWDPHQDVNYQQWNTAPFPVQIELNQFYRGDGLQPYFGYSDQSKGFATYHEANYFPEGVATSAARCCYFHATDPNGTAPAGFIVPDYRGDPEKHLLNPVNVITTDLPDVIGGMLEQLGRRNTGHLLNP